MGGALSAANGKRKGPMTGVGGSFRRNTVAVSSSEVYADLEESGPQGVARMRSKSVNPVAIAAAAKKPPEEVKRLAGPQKYSPGGSARPQPSPTPQPSPSPPASRASRSLPRLEISADPSPGASSSGDLCSGPPSPQPAAGGLLEPMGRGERSRSLPGIPGMLPLPPAMLLEPPARDRRSRSLPLNAIIEGGLVVPEGCDSAAVSDAEDGDGEEPEEEEHGPEGPERTLAWAGPPSPHRRTSAPSPAALFPQSPDTATPPRSRIAPAPTAAPRNPVPPPPPGLTVALPPTGRRASAAPAVPAPPPRQMSLEHRRGSAPTLGPTTAMAAAEERAYRELAEFLGEAEGEFAEELDEPEEDEPIDEGYDEEEDGLPDDEREARLRAQLRAVPLSRRLVARILEWTPSPAECRVMAADAIRTGIGMAHTSPPLGPRPPPAHPAGGLQSLIQIQPAWTVA